MRTDGLVDLLARHAGPAPRVVPVARLLPMAVLGLVIAIALAVSAMGVAEAARTLSPAFWIKVVYAAAIAVAAMAWSDRLARPGAPTRLPVLALTTIVVAMVGVGGAWALQGAQIEPLVMGSSWALCPWAILLLALPTIAGLLATLRDLQPVRPARTGFAAGLLGGAVAAMAYALVCYETSPAFVALWYSLGILVSGAAGALAGARVLRW